MKNKLKILLAFIGLVLTANFSVITPFSFSNISTIQEIENSNYTQLLRVAVNQDLSKNSINVYLYTSDSLPIIREKVSGSNGYIIELNDTMLATTNNVNLSKVSDKLEDIKIIPYLNVSNPSKPGITKLLITSKIPNLKYNVILKTVNTTNTSKKQVISKIYSPKTDSDTLPQNMSFFTPIEDKRVSVSSINKNTENKIQLAAKNYENNNKIKALPNIYFDNSYLAEEKQLKETIDPKLTVTSASELNTNDLIPEDPDPDKRTLPNIPNYEADQVGESPLPNPNPNLPLNGVETRIPRNIALILSIVCLPCVIIIIVLWFFVYKKMKKLQSKTKATQILSDAGLIQESNLMKQNYIIKDEPINENELLEPPSTVSKPETSNLNYNEDVEEIELIDSVQLTKNKTLYLIGFAGNVSLIASVNDEVSVLITFTSEQINVKSLSIVLTKEGNILGKEMFLVKIGLWEGVIASDNGNLYLQANLK